MKVKKFDSVLRKLNAVFETMRASEDTPSAMERDLIKSYLVQLYDICLDSNAVDKPKGQRKRKQPTPKPAVQEVVEETPAEITPVEAAPVVEKEKAVPTNGQSTRAIEEVAISEELEALFDTKKATDLSEKLSLLPIEDLSKAMGINEKVFTVQELFGGSESDFSETIQALNALSDFDAAKDHLVRGVAAKYDWGNEKNRKKAAHFIKLVRRRYA